MARFSLIIILIGILVPFKVSANPTQSNPTQPPKVVEVATARIGSVQRNAQLVGRIKSEKASTLRARRSGLIKQINVQDGAQVHKGEILLLIDDPEIVQRYELAKKQSDLAHEELERQRILLNSKTGTQKKVEQAQASWLVIKSIESQAKLEVDKHTATAPFDGMLGTFRFNQGAFVQEGDILVNVYDPSSLYVEFEIPGDASSKLHKQQKIHIASPLLTKPVLARINTIEGCIDSPTQTALVRAKIDDPTAMQPGEFVNINLTIDKSNKVVQVPQNAQFLNEGTPHAYIVQKDKLKLVAIETGMQGSGMIEIKKGINANDIVVVGGQLRLRNGEQIKVYTK